MLRADSGRRILMQIEKKYGFLSLITQDLGVSTEKAKKIYAI